MRKVIITSNNLRYQVQFINELGDIVMVWDYPVIDEITLQHIREYLNIGYEE